MISCPVHSQLPKSLAKTVPSSMLMKTALEPKALNSEVQCYMASIVYMQIRLHISYIYIYSNSSQQSSMILPAVEPMAPSPTLAASRFAVLPAQPGWCSWQGKSRPLGGWRGTCGFWYWCCMTFAIGFIFQSPKISLTSTYGPPRGTNTQDIFHGSRSIIR